MGNYKNILLTGGTGLIGASLTRRLLKKGYNVSHLSRSPGDNPQVQTYLWDVEKGIIDDTCVDGIDTIIHLAGANIAEERWTDERKKTIIGSRTKSIGLIYQLLKRRPNMVKYVISASAIGYYSDRGDELMTETSSPANDFMGNCCVAWEAAVDEGKDMGLRIVKFRTGVVLDQEGALKQLAVPVRLYVGSPLGTGKQWMPWIHIEDVIQMYIYAIENEKLSGVYNMVSPNPITNAGLTAEVAKHLKKPLWAPNVPAFLLKLILGEMSTMVLGSTKVSSKKIEDAGFSFKYPDIDSALNEIYG